MAKKLYEKPALTFHEQLQQLSDRGLIIENPEKAEHLLANLSYYRLSGYWHPFLQDKENHIFKQEVSFEQSFRVYCFDRQLKNLVVAELEKIEIALRSVLIYHYSHIYGAFWYLDNNLFIDPANHAQFIITLKDCFQRSKEEFIIKFKKNYADPLPPCWMGMELISFGALSKLYNNLKPGKTKRATASVFDVSDTVFESWLHALTYIRNTCAHHARLWNKVMKVQPSIPTTLNRTWLANQNVSNSRLYFCLSILLYLHQTVNPTTTFVKKLNALLDEYPEIDLSAMGFPEDWQKEKLWAVV